MARIFKRDGIWFAWVPKPGGGTRRQSTSCTDKRAAIIQAAILEREALDPGHAAANAITTREACAEFLSSRVRRGRAEGTLHHYRVKLGHVGRLMPAMLADVDAAACERFIEKRLEEGAAQTTVKKELRALGATLRHARRSGLYERDPAAVIPEFDDTYKPRERFLSPLELVALVNALPTERAAHVVFIVATGARWSESVRARLEDVAGSMVMLRGTKTARSLRTVPVPPTMRGALAWSLAHLPIDTLTRSAGTMFASWGNVRRDLGVACKAIGIAPITPNDLRRTFATWLRMSGVTPDIIGAALGHTTSRMAELVYGRIAPADLDRLISERGPALMLGPAPTAPANYPDRTGLLMGCDPVDSGVSGASPETADLADSACFSGAWRRSRTADTGIFNPGGFAANVGGSANFDADRAANGLTFGARARRWLMRVSA